MSNPTQSGPDRIRLALDHGEVVELDGGTLQVAGQTSPSSVVLRLTPWRARSLSTVLAEWSVISGVFNRPPRVALDERDLSRVLDMASTAAGDETEPAHRSIRPVPPGTVPERARLAAVAVLIERESRLTTIQRLALIDAASWWIAQPETGGPGFAHALLEAACTDGLAAEYAYLALIEPHNAAAEDEPS